ncbi:Adamts-Like Protein 3, partial [Manis pentadactyla]
VHPGPLVSLQHHVWTRRADPGGEVLEMELPEEECGGPKPSTEQPCLLEACDGDPASCQLDTSPQEKDSDITYNWEYAGFTPCMAT